METIGNSCVEKRNKLQTGRVVQRKGKNGRRRGLCREKKRILDGEGYYLKHK
jgi:hypothetical protein